MCNPTPRLSSANDIKWTCIISYYYSMVQNNMYGVQHQPHVIDILPRVLYNARHSPSSQTALFLINPEVKQLFTSFRLKFTS